MRRIVLLFALLISVYSISQAQDTWERKYASSFTNYEAFCETSDSVLYAMYRGTGTIRKSTNHGETWSLITTSVREPQSGEGYDLVADPNEQYLYAANNTFSYTGFGVKVSTDGGVTWTKKTNGMGADTNVVRLLVMPEGTVLADTYDEIGNKLFWSGDHAENWTLVDIDEEILISQIIPFKPGLSYGYVDGFKPYKTTDGGKTWVEITGIPGVAIRYISPDGMAFHISNDATSSSYATDPEASSWEQTTLTEDSFDPWIEPTGSRRPIFEWIGQDSIVLGGEGYWYPYLTTDSMKTFTAFDNGLDGNGWPIELYLSRKGYLFTTYYNKGLYRYSKPFKVANDVATSIDDGYEAKPFVLFPNPATQSFTIDANWEGVEQVSIVNSSGLAVYETDVSLNSSDILNPVNTSSWQPGVYIIRLMGDFGVSTRKVIVK